MTGGLTVGELTYRYSGAADDALAAVSLDVAGGEVLTVVGPSGSGKSTLLRLVAGLLRPQSGQVAIGGVDVTGAAPERRPVAMVFQGFALFPHLSVAENIGFGLRVRGVTRTERQRTVHRVAEVLGLGHLLRRLPSELSGGERQRTALGRALVREPRVFLLDEPLSSLDPLLRTDARRELSTVLRAEGRCAVYVTHDQSEALTVGDRVAVLRGGRLEQLGAPTEIYSRPATRFVAGFVGSPPMNLLTARDGTAGPLRPTRRVPDGWVLGVHAEDVRLDGAGPRLAVLGLEHHGHEVHVVLDADGQRLVARVPAAHAVGLGDPVPVRVDPERVRVFDETGRAV